MTRKYKESFYCESMWGNSHTGVQGLILCKESDPTQKHCVLYTKTVNNKKTIIDMPYQANTEEANS